MNTVIAILLAFGSACGLAFGAMYQHRGVSDQHRSTEKFRARQILHLLKDKQWMIGLMITGLGVACGTASLALAPVMVVQPVGAISLVISVLLAQRTRNLKVSKRIAVPVTLCTVGVASFVFVAALFAQTHGDLSHRAVPLFWVTVVCIVLFTSLRIVIRTPVQMLYVVAAGFLFACVAVNTHVVTGQFIRIGFADVPWLNLLALIAAAMVGSLFVQASHASGPPELAIAGLTVIDPIMAVALSIVLLGEADNATPWAIVVMCTTGLVACVGVLVLSKYHPDVLKRTMHNSTSTPAPAAATN